MDLETLRRIVFEEEEPLTNHLKRKIGETTTIAVHDLAPDDLIFILSTKLDRAYRAKVQEIKVLFDHQSTKAKRCLINFLSESSLVSKFSFDKKKAGIAWVSLNDDEVLH